MALAFDSGKNKAAQMSGLTESETLVSEQADKFERAELRQQELAARHWGHCQHRLHQGVEGEVHHRYVTKKRL